MADPHLVKLLRSGRRSWKWKAYRAAHPEQRDLSSADLGHLNLTRCDLSGMNLANSYVLGSDLAGANLRGANLSGANLIGVNLEGTDLREADLSFTTIAHVNLAAARTEGANFNAVNTESDFATYTPDGAVVPAPQVPAADPDHLRWLFRGVDAWNRWREQHPEIEFPDLLGAQLSGARFPGINLAKVVLPGATLSNADLSGANLFEAELEEATLIGANLRDAGLRNASMADVNLSYADLSGADLSDAWMSSADLTGAVLRNANLSGANLSEARINGTDLHEAVLTGCSVYGVSVWDTKGTPRDQSGLVLSKDYPLAKKYPGPREGQADVTIDDLEVAQFVYLILNNPKLRNVIDTIGNKGVLVLGRFSERKDVLEALRSALRRRNYLPIVFDFERPATRDFTETVMVLAGMSLFIIADITAPRSVPLELEAAVPNFMIPFVPLLQEGEPAFAMFQDLVGKYDWVLELLEYDSAEHLVAGLDAAVIRPAMAKHEELLTRKARELSRRHISDYLAQ